MLNTKPVIGSTFAAFKMLLISLVILIVSGCAGDVNMLPTLTEHTQLKNNQGVVVVRVINASTYPLPFNQLTITPKNLNESKKIKPSRLQAVYTPKISSTIFSSPVSSGSYSLDSLRAFHSRGEFWYSKFVPADAKFGSFEVKAGQVTDLGTVIYYPKPQKDKYLNILLRQSSDTPASVLSTFFPKFTFDAEQVSTWRDDELQDERDSTYVSIAQNPLAYNKVYLAPDGSVYFIGKLGVILKRAVDGEWSLDAVATNLDLFTMAKNEQGDLIIGGNEGEIFYKGVNDENWLDISLDASHDVEEVQFNLQGDIEAITRQTNKVNVFRATVANNRVDWQHITSYSSNEGWDNIVYGQSQSLDQTEPKLPKKILSKINKDKK